MKVVRLKVNPRSRDDYWIEFFDSAMKCGKIPKSDLDYFQVQRIYDYDEEFGTVSVLSIPQGKFVEFWMRYFFTLPDDVMCYLDGDKNKPCYF